jgi:hypothetical protein
MKPAFSSSLPSSTFGQTSTLGYEKANCEQRFVGEFTMPPPISATAKNLDERDVVVFIGMVALTGDALPRDAAACRRVHVNASLLGERHGAWEHVGERRATGEWIWGECHLDAPLFQGVDPRGWSRFWVTGQAYGDSAGGRVWKNVTVSARTRT